MVVTVEGMVNAEFLLLGYISSVKPSFVNNTPLLEAYEGLSVSTLMLDKLVQRIKAPNPMRVTLAGIFMVDKLLHSRNAYFPMEVTDVGIRKEDKLLQ